MLGLILNLNADGWAQTLKLAQLAQYCRVVSPVPAKNYHSILSSCRLWTGFHTLSWERQKMLWSDFFNLRNKKPKHPYLWSQHSEDTGSWVGGQHRVHNRSISNTFNVCVHACVWRPQEDIWCFFYCSSLWSLDRAAPHWTCLWLFPPRDLPVCVPASTVRHTHGHT